MFLGTGVSIPVPRKRKSHIGSKEAELEFPLGHRNEPYQNLVEMVVIGNQLCWTSSSNVHSGYGVVGTLTN